MQQILPILMLLVLVGGNEVMQLIVVSKRKLLRHRLNALAIEAQRRGLAEEDEKRSRCNRP
jgi:hypothetical protein